MANTFLTPDIIAREALMVLRKNAVLSRLVYRDYSADFNGAVGDTITIRKPATFTAAEFTTAITTQDATESGIEVTLDKHIDVSFAVTAKQMALEINDFSQQLLVPAMQAFADKIDGYLITEALTTTNEVSVASGETIGQDVVVDARKILTANAAPLTERRFVYNSETEAELLKTPLFISAEQVGDAGTALREASLGRKFGLDFYVDQNIDSAASSAIAFHRNGIALVTRQLALPQGAGKAAIVNYDGFALRVVYDYDITSKTDVISIDMLCGVKMLDNHLVVKVTKAA